MDDETNKFLTERMGECWHEFDPGSPVLTCKGGGFICRRCREFVFGNRDFSTEEDFARLMEWARSREEPGGFLAGACPGPADRPLASSGARARFATALHRFLVEG